MQANQFTKLCMDSKLVNGTTMSRAMCDVIWFRARAELESLESWKRKGSEYITPKVLPAHMCVCVGGISNCSPHTESGI